MAMPDRTRPSNETRSAERREARRGSDAGDEPTPEEARAADENTLDDDVSEHYEEMIERGAHQEGEGRIA